MLVPRALACILRRAGPSRLRINRRRPAAENLMNKVKGARFRKRPLHTQEKAPASPTTSGYTPRGRHKSGTPKNRSKDRPLREETQENSEAGQGSAVALWFVGGACGCKSGGEPPHSKVAKERILWGGIMDRSHVTGEESHVTEGFA